MSRWFIILICLLLSGCIVNDNNVKRDDFWKDFNEGSLCFKSIENSKTEYHPEFKFWAEPTQ